MNGIKKPKKILHKHDSIPTYISGLEDGCVTCIRNQAIADYEAWLKEIKEFVNLVIGFCVNARETWDDWEEHQEIGILYAKATIISKRLRGEE